VLVASHIFFLYPIDKHMYYGGYIAPICYHNPTQQLSKLLALAITLLYGRCIIRNRVAPWTMILLLGVCCVLSAIAKPAFLIAFVPAAGVVGIWHLLKNERHRVIAAITGIALPSAVVLGIQYLSTYGSGTGAGIIWAPFVVGGGASTLLLHIPASFLFPILALVPALFARCFPSRLLFAWLLSIIGVGESFLLAESGPRMVAGNFFWTAHTVMFLLYVESALFLISRPLRHRIFAWSGLALHVIFGIFFYVATAVLPPGRYL
jgi:hypothetical protein